MSSRLSGRPTRHSLESPGSIVSKDAFTWMSAEVVEESSHAVKSESEDPTLPPSYPLPLVLFVCFLSIIGGLVVSVVHYAILFSGCPLGLNGCNSFSPSKEKYGFFLLRALNSSIPEDVIFIVAAMLGGLIIAQMSSRLPDHLAFQISGGGTVQALMAVASGQAGERISLSAASVRLIASCIYLGSGGTLGMDGPAIQICTAITTFCGWSLGMRGVETQALLASIGFAAGFAASFNAPLAGIMFAMEELSHVCPNLSRHMICIILIVSIVATAVARFFFGNKELFKTEWSGDVMQEISGGSLNKVFGEHMWMLISVPIAIVCSLVGLLMSIMMHKLRLWMLYAQGRLPFSVLVILLSSMSAAIGCVAFRLTNLRGVWGIGYESLQRAFDQHHSFSDYSIFALCKMLATVMALAWRAPGDLLEPILIIGAFLGGGVGSILRELVGDDEFGQRIMQPCLVFGMVSFFASCFRFPLTPVLIVLEVTGVESYALVLPAALSAFTAVIVSNRLYAPLLDSIMHEDGINLHRLNADAIEASLPAGDVKYDGRDVEDPESEKQQAGSESDLSEALSATSSAASGKFRTIFRDMESSMLALSHPKSRSTSRSNSNNSKLSSPFSASVDPKLSTLLRTLREGKGIGNSPQSHSRTPSKTSNATSISLNMPPSEHGHVIRLQTRSCTQSSTKSNGHVVAISGNEAYTFGNSGTLVVVPGTTGQDASFLAKSSAPEQVCQVMDVRSFCCWPVGNSAQVMENATIETIDVNNRSSCPESNLQASIANSVTSVSRSVGLTGQGKFDEGNVLNVFEEQSSPREHIVAPSPEVLACAPTPTLGESNEPLKSRDALDKLA